MTASPPGVLEPISVVNRRRPDTRTPATCVKSGSCGRVWGDLTLAILVIGIVAMLILPLPAAVMDGLLSINIAAAVTLLLTSLYVTDALKIATFATLLLLTTLFRLALEVSATRLILSRGS